MEPDIWTYILLVRDHFKTEKTESCSKLHETPKMLKSDGDEIFPFHQIGKKTSRLGLVYSSKEILTRVTRMRIFCNGDFRHLSENSASYVKC